MSLIIQQVFMRMLSNGFPFSQGTQIRFNKIKKEYSWYKNKLPDQRGNNSRRSYHSLFELVSVYLPCPSPQDNCYLGLSILAAKSLSFPSACPLHDIATANSGIHL